jgi:hypothetical protein
VIVPANWEIMIAFAPESNDDGTVETAQNGFIKVRAFL